MKTKKEEKHSHLWNYKNLIILIASIILAVYLITSQPIRNFIHSLGNYSYLGALVTGLFFSYAFTTAPATATFLILGRTGNPILLGLIGGLGAMLSDFLIFIYIKKGLPADLKYIIKKTGITKIRKIKHTKIGWVIPLIAGAIIASPLPDELGSFLFGVYNFPTKKFLIYSYILNSIGLIIISALG